MPTSSTTLLTAALAIAGRGWPVFPLNPGGSFPALHSVDDCPGTGPCTAGHRKWEQRATTDPDRVRGCWSHGAYNIGLATGPAGLLVVDLDMPKPGKPVPERWAAQGAESGMDVFLLVCADAGHPPPLDTMTVQTPSGGTHLYFTAPADARLRITQGERGHGLGWGIDTRGWGGYVVAPGSIRRDGSYTITDDRPPAPLPAWLVDRLTPTPLPPQQPTAVATTAGRRTGFLRAAIDGEIRRVTTAEGGGRNFALYCAANALGQLVAGGALGEQEVTDELLAAAHSHVAADAYSWAQARRTIASGLRAGAARPRRMTA
ncbi:bifunctional DNA primase/polymerase [Saccharopolyspora taberi]|uniref:Bifunctional DNA primase/polymerase n=1 Tax=Saccharopolyspora taberi TaxID=60895 RepID=A0ABN3V8E3_9PSEU